MFMLKRSHDAIVEEIRAGGALIIQRQQREIGGLRADCIAFEDNLDQAYAEIAGLLAQLAERQVPAVRDTTTGRFTKREG